VKKENEAELETSSKRTHCQKQGKRGSGACRHVFLETLVRLHRAGEGEPYTGLKPAGVVESAVVEADKAFENGSVESLVKLITEGASKEYVSVSIKRKRQRNMQIIA